MTRRHFGFACEGQWLAATLDEAPGTTALLIVSGGNELRCGPHGSMAALAAELADSGFPVMRFDPPGVGESEGDNGGFRTRTPAIRAAMQALRAEAPQVSRIIAMGNCDGAAALLLDDFGFDALILCNPWTRDDMGTSSLANEDEAAPALPSAAAIRQRYWARLKQPGRLLRDLAGGAIDWRKLAKGLARLGQKPTPPGEVASAMARQLAASSTPVHLLIARQDGTAMGFMAAYQAQGFAAARRNPQIALHMCDTASHSFADPVAKTWLRAQILAALQR